MTAAKVLVDHLSQMSGAKLEIRPVGDLGNAVVLNGVVSAEAGKVDATIKSFIFIGDSALAKQAGFSSEGLEQGGILVKSDGNALARHNAENPVNVPTSTMSRAPVAATSNAISAPCSGAICMPEMSPSAAVSAIRAEATSSTGAECAIR